MWGPELGAASVSDAGADLGACCTDIGALASLQEIAAKARPSEVNKRRMDISLLQLS
jgi:hypothetical protein